MIRSGLLTSVFFILVSFYNLSIAQEHELKPGNMTRLELTEAIRNHEEILLRYPANEFTPRLLFQLSELFIRKARLDYEVNVEKFERKLKEFKNGLTTVEPSHPKINYIPTIAILEKVLTIYPSSGFNDKIIYRLAICYQERGEDEKSISFFKIIIKDYPLSNLYAEAYFRVGEYYFNKGSDIEAIPYFTQLVKSDMWSNPFFDMSLYKLGWCYYRLDQYPEAISSFMFLLKDIRTIERIQTQKLDLSASDLKKEAIDYIAACFTEFSEPDQVFEFLDSFADSTYTFEIISKLADVYFQHNMLNETITTYNHLNSKFPNSAEAPFFTMKIVKAYENKWDLPVANIIRQKLIDLYNPESTWYAVQKDSIAKEKAIVLTKSSLINKGIYHQQLAREKIDKQLDYQQAIDQYEHFLRLFPQDSLAYKINYYLAESYYSAGKFEEAGAEYKKCYSLYPDSKFNEKAAFNSVISYSKAIENSRRSEPITLTITPFFDHESLVTIQVTNMPTKEFILASHEYVSRFPTGGKVVESLMKEAEVLIKLQYPQLARLIYKKIINDYPNNSQNAKAMILIAQSFFQEENYKEAEHWYKTVASTFADSLEIANKAKVMMSSSVFKIAEKHKLKGEFGLAAEQYTKIAFQNQESEITELALVEAGKMYEAVGNITKSAQLFESYIQIKPGSRLLGFCALQAAKYREKMNDWLKAAENYLIIKKVLPELWPATVFSVGNCYAKAGDWNSSITNFEEYIEIGNGSTRILEAQCRIGLAAIELNQPDKAISAFQKTVDKFQAMKSSTSTNAYYPAKAQYMLAELNLSEYSKIEISPPFKESLNKKSIALRKVLQAYTDAAKYRIFEWTTASSFKIGKVFEEFANAILVSALPKSLADEEIVTYESQLRILARPFQKKALEAHLSNVKQAQDNKTENSWTELSRERIVIISSIIDSDEKIENNP